MSIRHILRLRFLEGILMMLCLNCAMPAEREALYCGHCGLPLLQSQLQVDLPTDELVQVPQIEQQESSRFGNASMVGLTAELFPATHSRTPIPQGEPLSPPSSPPRGTSSSQHVHTPYRSTTRRNIAFIVTILALLAVGIGAGLLALWQNKYIHQHMSIENSIVPVPVVSGTVSFHDSVEYPDSNDSLTIHLQGVAVPPAKAYYAAWLFDSTKEVFYPLGSLTKSGSGYILDYTDNGQHRNLLLMGNKVQITQETMQTLAPTGVVIASAQFPPQASIYMRHLLVSSPVTPDHSALLPGLYTQTQTLAKQAQSLRTAHSQIVLQCVALNMITLLEGQRDTAFNPHNCNAGHVSLLQEPQWGLLMSKNNNNGYVQAVATQASLTATQNDATDAMRNGAQHIVVTTDNVQRWLKTLDADAHALLKNPTNDARIGEMVSLANEANDGGSQSGNEMITVNQNQAGAWQLYLYGQSMTTLPLTH